MASPLNPVPPRAGPPGPDAAARLNDRWRALSFAFDHIPQGPAHSAFRAVRRSEPRPWAGERFARLLGAIANNARLKLPLDGRRAVRAAGDAVLDELRAQWHAALPVPEDAQAPGLSECARGVLREAAGLIDSALVALADGRLDARELDDLETEAADVARHLEWLQRRVACERGKLVGRVA